MGEFFAHTANIGNWQLILATGHWNSSLWRTKKDKAPHEMAAIRIRSGLALKLSAGRLSPEAQSSCGNGARG